MRVVEGVDLFAVRGGERDMGRPGLVVERGGRRRPASARRDFASPLLA
jgi:hypothetical protein